MRKTIISLIFLLIPILPTHAAETSALREDAPERYTVVPGDTLWSIAGRFLKDPWKWPELWKMNQEQIRNPHRIYPGDVIVLDRTGAAAQLRLERAALPTVRLSPKVRAEPLKDKAVPAISPTAIEPFLTRPLVVGPGELDSAPVVLATQENRVAVSAGDIAYVEGLPQNGSGLWQVFRRGDALVDPDTNEILGYLANYLGEVRVLKPGAQSTVQVVRAQQEIYAGDRLVSAAKERPTFSYVPRAPTVSVRGRIMTTYGNLGETGPAGIVALSKGAKDGLEVGHVLAIYRSQSTAQYEMRTSPLYGRQGPSGSDAPRTYYGEKITPRDGPLVSRGQPISAESVARLPDERYGLVMVFRTFDRAAFGLVMQASRPVAVNDVVTNP
jgi:hypothetical protein